MRLGALQAASAASVQIGRVEEFGRCVSAGLDALQMSKNEKTANLSKRLAKAVRNTTRT